MKNQVLFTLLAMLVSVSAFSHDIEVANADGVTIYYNYINDGTELAVTFRGSNSSSYSNEYQGNVVIPEEVTYMNRARKVTSIGERAFFRCENLTSITIPNNVTSIGEYAFYFCQGLTSFTIPNNVTSIGEYAFWDCTNLASIIIPSKVSKIAKNSFGLGLTSIIVDNSNASFCSDDGVLFNKSKKALILYPKSKIGSYTIPNDVKYIREEAFSSCSRLTSITIPNSVLTIGKSAFKSCRSLTSVIIPNSVTSIGESAFSDCSSLTSVTISNSVTNIEARSFYSCSNLTSVTIPNSVTSIGDGAFNGDISKVISLIENPFVINTNTFSDNTFYNGTLYVPKGTKRQYKKTEGWNKFIYIEEGTGDIEDIEDPEPPVTPKCSTPTISNKNGKLVFDCETEGVTFIYSIQLPNSMSNEGNNVSVPSAFIVSVYAKKDKYLNSDIVTKEIKIGGATTDVNGDGIVDTQDVLEIYKYIQEH